MFQTLFLFARLLPLLRIVVILDNIGGVRAQKSPKKGYFVNAESVRKTLETTNAMLMKLTTILYHECVNQKALRARNSLFGLIQLHYW